MRSGEGVPTRFCRIASAVGDGRCLAGWVVRMYMVRRPQGGSWMTLGMIRRFPRWQKTR